MDFSFGLYRFKDIKNLFSILYLGLGASAICFVSWSYAVKILGPVKTSVFIYLVPVVALISSRILLDEKITNTAIFATVLIILGLFISDTNVRKIFKIGKK